MRVLFLLKAKCLLVGVTCLFSLAAVAQTSRKLPDADPGVSSTPAYAEVLLKRTETEAELESLLVEYTEDFPKVRQLRFARSRVDSDIARLSQMKPGHRDRATLALGKLMVRKIEAEVDLWKLQQDYADEHPEVKRAKKKVEIFEKAIKEILG